MRRTLTLLALAALPLLATAPATADTLDVQVDGKAKNSPGIVSGNIVQAPVHVPVNACGNTISVVGVLNPTFGNYCVNE